MPSDRKDVGLFIGVTAVFFNSENGWKVTKKPSLDGYDARPAMTEQQQADFSQEFVAHGASTHARDKALLVKLGVNGEVPLAQAMVNAGLASDGIDPLSIFVRATRAANDNEQSRMAA